MTETVMKMMAEKLFVFSTQTFPWRTWPVVIYQARRDFPFTPASDTPHGHAWRCIGIFASRRRDTGHSIQQQPSANILHASA
jgi:hypothetical protein